MFCLISEFHLNQKWNFCLILLKVYRKLARAKISSLKWEVVCSRETYLALAKHANDRFLQKFVKQMSQNKCFFFLRLLYVCKYTRKLKHVSDITLEVKYWRKNKLRKIFFSGSLEWGQRAFKVSYGNEVPKTSKWGW